MLLFTILLHLVLVSTTVIFPTSQAATLTSKRCQSPAVAPHRIEKVIADCQDEIKLALLQEALVELEASTAALASRTKREAFTEGERRIAGCLLQCVYKKVRAVDGTGFPTREGLVRLYAEGVQERGYYLATAQASQQCLQEVQQLRPQAPAPPSGSQSCDIAYDLFECISNKISEYCSGSD